MLKLDDRCWRLYDYMNEKRGDKVWFQCSQQQIMDDLGWSLRKTCRIWSKLKQLGYFQVKRQRGLPWLRLFKKPRQINKTFKVECIKESVSKVLTSDTRFVSTGGVTNDKNGNSIYTPYNPLYRDTDKERDKYTKRNRVHAFCEPHAGRGCACAQHPSNLAIPLTPPTPPRSGPGRMEMQGWGVDIKQILPQGEESGEVLGEEVGEEVTGEMGGEVDEVWDRVWGEPYWGWFLVSQLGLLSSSFPEAAAKSIPRPPAHSKTLGGIKPRPHREKRARSKQRGKKAGTWKAFSNAKWCQWRRDRARDEILVLTNTAMICKKPIPERVNKYWALEKEYKGMVDIDPNTGEPFVNKNLKYGKKRNRVRRSTQENLMIDDWQFEMLNRYNIRTGFSGSNSKNVGHLRNVLNHTDRQLPVVKKMIKLFFDRWEHIKEHKPGLCDGSNLPSPYVFDCLKDELYAGVLTGKGLTFSQIQPVKNSQTMNISAQKAGEDDYVSSWGTKG